MFCENCGTENKDYSTYCINDGSKLRENNININMTKQKLKYCSECGSDMNDFSTYCSGCGESTFTIAKASEKNTNTSFKKLSVDKIPKKISSTIANNIDLKRILSLGVIGFISVFIMGLIFSSFVNNVIAKDFGAIFAKSKLISVKDMTLLFNSLKFDLSLFVNGSEAIASFEFGTMLLLIVPFIVFTIIGIVSYNFDMKKNSKFNILNLLLPGLIYGVFLFLLSLIGRSSLEIPFWGFGMNIELVKVFGAFSILLRGVLISGISMMFGYGLYSKIKKNKGIIYNYDSIFNGIFNFIIALTLIFVLVNISISIYAIDDLGINSFLDTEGAGYTILAALFATPYIFLFSNFSSLRMLEVTENINENFSIFKFDDGFYSNMFVDFQPIVYIGVLIIFAVLFIEGRKIKQNHGEDIKGVIYTSATYTLCMAVLSYLISISISVDGPNLYLIEYFERFDYLSLTFGFKIVSVILGSFLLALLSTFSGYLLTNNKGYIKENSHD